MAIQTKDDPNRDRPLYFCNYTVDAVLSTTFGGTLQSIEFEVVSPHQSQ